MIVRPAWIALVLVTASNGFGQAAPGAGSTAAAPAKAAAPQGPAAPKTPPPAAAKTAPGGAKKVEEVPKIAGLTIGRPNGAFLGLQVVNGNFVLTFYDKEKKKTKVDAARATLRWPVKYQPADERTVLNPGGPNTLTSAKGVRPPLSFKVYIALFIEGSDTAVESYVVDYREDAAPAAGAAAKTP